MALPVETEGNRRRMWSEQDSRSTETTRGWITAGQKRRYSSHLRAPHAHSHQCSCLYTGRTAACFAAAGSAQHRPSRDSPTPLPFVLQVGRHQPQAQRAYAAVIEQQLRVPQHRGSKGDARWGRGHGSCRDRQLGTGCIHFRRRHIEREGSAAARSGCALASELRQALHAERDWCLWVLHRSRRNAGEHRRGAENEPCATGIGEESSSLRTSERQRAIERRARAHLLASEHADAPSSRGSNGSPRRIPGAPRARSVTETRAQRCGRARVHAKCAARAAPGGRPRRLLVFAPRGVRAGGTWQMLRAHLRQNHSAMYSSQTEQSSSPIVRAASPRPPHPGLAPCAGRPAAACRLPWPFLNDEIGVYRPRYGAKVAGTNLKYQAGTRQYERGKISQPAHVCASAVVTGKSGNGGSAGTYSM